MPGTGHSYEIANAGSLRSVLAAFGTASGCAEGVRWFSSRHLLKDLTGEGFVRPATASDVDGLDETSAGCDPFLVRREFEAGRDVRMFDALLFRSSSTERGWDLDHVADWIRSLRDGGDPFLSKLGRMRVRDAASAAARWTAELAKERRGPGTVEDLLSLPDGSRWIALLDGTALLDEGAGMRHCVGSYADSIRDFLFLSLRDESGRSRLTARLVRDRDGGRPRLVETKGFANARPGPTHAAAVLAMLVHLDVHPCAAFCADLADVMPEHDGTGWRLPHDFPEGSEGGRRVLVGAHSVFVPGADGNVRGRVWTASDVPDKGRKPFLDVVPGCLGDDLEACVDVANALGIRNSNTRLVEDEDGILAVWTRSSKRVDVAGHPLRRCGNGLVFYGHLSEPVAEVVPYNTCASADADSSVAHDCDLRGGTPSPSDPSPLWDAVAAIMTELRVSRVGGQDVSGVFGLAMGADGTWIHRPSRTRTFGDRLWDGAEIVWSSTPIDLVGHDGEGRAVVRISLKAGRPQAGWIDRSVSRTALRSLERILATECPVTEAVPVALVVRDAGGAASDVWLCPSEGRWKATSSWRIVAETSPPVGSRPEGWTPLSVLPAAGTHPDCDRILAGELAADFLSRTSLPREPEGRDYRWRPSPSRMSGTSSRIPRRTPAGRLLEMVHLLGSMEPAVRRKVLDHLVRLVEGGRLLDRGWNSEECDRRFALAVAGRAGPFLTKRDRTALLRSTCVPARSPWIGRLGVRGLGFDRRTAEAVEGMRVLSSALDPRSRRAGHFRRFCMETIEGMSAHRAATTGGMAEAMAFLCGQARKPAWSATCAPRPEAAASVLSRFSDAMWRDRRNVRRETGEPVRILHAVLMAQCASARKRSSTQPSISA